MKYSIGIVAVLSLLVMVSCTSFDTKPILGSGGKALPGSIASLERVTLGGVQQWILIRGNSGDLPLLLKLHGGPGQAEMATVGYNRILEKNFIVVEWDQRGAGKSAQAFEPREAMTVSQLVEDTHELTQLLLKRFHQSKLILVGHSWGSLLGALTVKKYPNEYQAFVTTGQISDLAEGLKASYHFLLDEAKELSNTEALADLTRLGLPPYTGNDRNAKRNTFGKWLDAFGAAWHGTPKWDRAGMMIAAVEYAWPEKFGFTSAAEKTLDALLPELMSIDLNSTASQLGVPVYFAVGRFDHMSPFEVSRRYFDHLEAPHKEWIWFEASGHFPQWEEPEKFSGLLNRVFSETKTKQDKSF